MGQVTAYPNQQQEATIHKPVAGPQPPKLITRAATTQNSQGKANNPEELPKKSGKNNRTKEANNKPAQTSDSAGFRQKTATTKISTRPIKSQQNKGTHEPKGLEYSKSTKDHTHKDSSETDKHKKTTRRHFTTKVSPKIPSTRAQEKLKPAIKAPSSAERNKALAAGDLVQRKPSNTIRLQAQELELKKTKNIIVARDSLLTIVYATKLFPASSQDSTKKNSRRLEAAQKIRTNLSKLGEINLAHIHKPQDLSENQKKQILRIIAKTIDYLDDYLLHRSQSKKYEAKITEDPYNWQITPRDSNREALEIVNSKVEAILTKLDEKLKRDLSVDNYNNFKKAYFDFSKQPQFRESSTSYLANRVFAIQRAISSLEEHDKVKNARRTKAYNSINESTSKTRSKRGHMARRHAGAGARA